MAIKRRAFLETLGVGLMGTGLAHAQTPPARRDPRSSAKAIETPHLPFR